MEALSSVFSAVRRKARGDRTAFTLINMLSFVARKPSSPWATAPPSQLSTESYEEPKLFRLFSLKKDKAVPR